MNKTHKELYDWAQQGLIPNHKIDQAVRLLELRPKEKNWQQMLDRSLLWLGSFALIFSLMFFIAYNWQEMGRFFKFGLIQIFMLVAMVVYYKSAENSLVNQVSIVIATIGVGILLAFYGQTYQTGADSWQLFCNWALLIVPWVLICRTPLLWLFWLLLINVAIYLYYEVWGNHFFIFSASFVKSSVGVLFIFNTIALIIWQLFELKANKRGVLLSRAHSIAIRLLATASGMHITYLMFHALFSEHDDWINYCIWGAWLAAMYYMYRKIKLDVFMLAGGCLSVLVIAVVFIFKYLTKGSDSFAVFILIALFIIGLTTLFAKWLKKIYEESLS